MQTNHCKVNLFSISLRRVSLKFNFIAPKRTGSADERQTIRKASQQNNTTYVLDYMF